MKTIYYSAASLDGYIATKDDSLEWLFRNGPSDLSFIDDFISTVGSIAMGSATYKWLLENNNGPWPYKVPCLILTHQKLEKVPDSDIRFVSGDVKSIHNELKSLADGKNVWIVGGGELAGQFFDHGLIDEMHIQTISVFLNEGKKLFPRVVEKALKIKSVIQRGQTCVDVIYEVQK